MTCLCYGGVVLKKIVEDIKTAKVFTVMMDETTDISGNKQATIIIWFADNEESIQEHLIGFSDVSRTDSETIFTLTLLNNRPVL